MSALETCALRNRRLCTFEFKKKIRCHHPTPRMIYTHKQGKPAKPKNWKWIRTENTVSPLKTCARRNRWLRAFEFGVWSALPALWGRAHVCTYTYTHTYKQILWVRCMISFASAMRESTQLHIHTHIHPRTHTHTWTHKYTRVYTNTYVQFHVCTRPCMHTCTHAHINKHIHAHTETQT